MVLFLFLACNTRSRSKASKGYAEKLRARVRSTRILEALLFAFEGAFRRTGQSTGYMLHDVAKLRYSHAFIMRPLPVSPMRVSRLDPALC